MPISEDLINRAKRYPKQKELGQNFLVDSQKLSAIVSGARLDPKQDVVLEIGPGIGFLTELLVDHVYQLFAVELDANALTSLNILKANHKNFDFIRADFLSLSIEQILSSRPEILAEIQSGTRPKLKVVANIPYQISTKILLHILGEMGSDNPNRHLVSEINILVQKEFAERLCAKPGTKAYGAITLLINYWAEVFSLVDVPKECFRPIPKVDSCFIKIKLRDKPLVHAQNPKQLRRFIKAIFANRRKVLSNGLMAAGYSPEQIKSLNLPEKLRGETLTLPEIAHFVEILATIPPNEKI
jgi:16S rRNA (adenine1518-N6/adenine1519-N6)-dimethyltransferase